MMFECKVVVGKCEGVGVDDAKTTSHVPNKRPVMTSNPFPLQITVEFVALAMYRHITYCLLYPSLCSRTTAGMNFDQYHTS
jgi:hypothetical protein